MCGIAGFFLRDPNLKIDRDAMLDSLLMSIEHRGKDATGFVAIGEEGDNEWHKASCEAKTFCAHRRFVPQNARVVIGHTRWATQGLPEFMENNHPIKRGPYFIVHNGHVNNDIELFKSAERDRFGWVDSEAIAARLSSMDDLARLNEVMEEIDGDAAVAAVDERDPSKLVLARGRSSPLYVYSGRVIVIFASTKTAVEDAHKAHVGHMAPARLFELKEGVQFFYDDQELHTSEFKVKKKVYSWSNPANGYAGKSTTPNSNVYYDGYDEEMIEYLGGGLTQDCDSCNTPIYWRDVIYRYDPDQNYTNGFCEECAEIWDWGKIQKATDEALGGENEFDDGGICQNPHCWERADEKGPDGVRRCDMHAAEYAQEAAEARLALEPGPNTDPQYLNEDYANANETILRQMGRLFGI